MSTLYLRLKTSIVFKIYRMFYEKLKNQFRNTERDSQTTFSSSGNKKKDICFEKKLRIFFGRCRIVPKNVKGETLWDLLTNIQLQNIKNIAR